MIVDDPGSAPQTLTVTAVTQGAHGSVTLNGNGTVTYLPNNGFAGTDTFTYTVSDGHGGTANGTVTVTIKAPVALSPSSLPNGNINVGYNQSVIASGGTAPYQYSVSSGSLPGGMALHSTTGVIDGVPTQSGTFTFTIQARDSSSPVLTGSRSYTVVIP
jgi:hypothetical protein